MKTLKLIAVSTVAFAAFACGPSVPSRAQDGETCFGTPTDCRDLVVESCCNAGGTQCTYRISDGKDFPCNGSDCQAAASDAVAYCKQ